MPIQKPKKEKTLCREYAAEYLGVSSATLKKLPIPYVQYSRFSYALYRVEDLNKFKQSRTFTPEYQGVAKVA